MASNLRTGGGSLMDFITAPRPKYTIVGEAIRYMIPGHMQCSIGCGGQTCKYENPTYWREDQQAIKGLYSSWITENLLAMSRPSTEVIENYNIIDQFQRNGIKTVINLQIPGEHANCGNPLEQDSGFSYCPEVFMENNIFFYNFGWDDYGVASFTILLDMMKVMAFALQEGKIAVHCHAGLGRTGVLLASFLAYGSKMTANEAISFVRTKRPNSIQTRGQLRCVRGFVQFFTPLRSVFSCAVPLTNRVTLSQFLNRQRHVLHGTERKELRHLPKIVQLVCKLLVDIAENRQVIEEDILEAPDIQDIEMTLSIIEQMDPDMLGKKPRLPGSPTLPRHFNEPAIFYHRKSLSYSESDLRRLGSQLNLFTQPLTSLSKSEIALHSISSQGQLSNSSEVSCSSTGSLWQVKNEESQKDGTIVLKKLKRKKIQRSESTGNTQTAKKGSMLSRWKAEKREKLTNGTTTKGVEEEQSEVPFITLQSELSLEARRLLVAQALAVDLLLDGQEEHKSKMLSWQAELNQGGAWERLCTERDPFILAGLMWSWLEQLKEPIISMQDTKALNPHNVDPQTVLDPLDQASKETLTCILDCMAHMRDVSKEIEDAFLHRTIKACTWIDIKSEEGSKVYEGVSTIFRFMLEEMRLAAITSEEAPAATLSYYESSRAVMIHS